MRRSLLLAVTFIVAVSLVLVGAIVAGAVIGDGTPEPPAIDNEQFDPATVLPDRPTVGGAFRMTSNATGERIVVDTAHNNDVTDREIAPLVNVLATNGHHVRSYDGVSLLSFRDALDDADALLVVNPEQSYTHQELDAIRAFIDAGGRVMVAMDPGSRNALVDGQGSLGETTIYSEIGIEREPGFLYNAETNENNYLRVYAEPKTASPLTEGVDRIVLPGASTVDILHGRIAFETDPVTQLSTTGRIVKHPVVVHDDNVVFVGDSSFLHPENARHADNNVLIGNLADFLVEGDKTNEGLDGNDSAASSDETTTPTDSNGNETAD